MRTVILGKKIETKYDVVDNQIEIKDDNDDFKFVYTGKPSIDKKSKVVEWVELCRYDGEPRYNYQRVRSLWEVERRLNISETETVVIEEEIFRADLNEMHLHLDKVAEEIEINKEEALSICAGQIRAFNKTMIESNNKLMSYCDLHKLSYEDTDCIELFNLVFPNEDYIIENGVIKAKEQSQPKYYFFSDTKATIGQVTGLTSLE